VRKQIHDGARTVSSSGQVHLRRLASSSHPLRLGQAIGPTEAPVAGNPVFAHPTKKMEPE